MDSREIRNQITWLKLQIDDLENAWRHAFEKEHDLTPHVTQLLVKDRRGQLKGVYIESLWKYERSHVRVQLLRKDGTLGKQEKVTSEIRKV